MDEKTPGNGQVAYEAYEWERSLRVGDRLDGWPLLKSQREWEAAGKAVADRVSAPLLQRIEELEAENRKLKSGGPYRLQECACGGLIKEDGSCETCGEPH